MKRTKTSYEQAVLDFNNYYGYSPTVNEMNAIYFAYGNNWKQYKDFAEFMIYAE